MLTGGKIKSISVVLMILQMILVVISSFVLIGYISAGLGVIILIVGLITTWVEYGFLYVFGETAEDVKHLIHQVHNLQSDLDTIQGELNTLKQTPPQIALPVKEKTADKEPVESISSQTVIKVSADENKQTKPSPTDQFAKACPCCGTTNSIAAKKCWKCKYDLLPN